jgi:PIN domain nuclease of toxin-antitoxin system
MVEVARKYFREGAKQQTIYARLEAIASASTVNPIGIELAAEAAKCHMELSQQARKAKLRTPSLFDASTLATARLLKAKVLTGDEHFRSQLETIWIGS